MDRIDRVEFAQLGFRIAVLCLFLAGSLVPLFPAY
jgi:hypothetical protein